LDYRRHADGSLSGRFTLDPVTAEAFDTVLDARLAGLSAEQRAEHTPTQLRHDALRDLLLGVLRSGELPATGGVTTTMIVTLTLEQYAAVTALHTSAGRDTGVGTAARQARAPGERGGDRLAVTGHDALLTIDELAPLLGDAQVFPVALDECDEQPSASYPRLGAVRRIEAYGDTHRIFTANQRLALAARDAGCSFPGCTSGPAWCEAHHVIDHADGGRTSVDNATLLCPYHHRSHHRLGYRCHMRGGVPYWTPPRWLDPTMTPIRNSAHATPPTRGDGVRSA
jgi:hypothetical protein